MSGAGFTRRRRIARAARAGTTAAVAAVLSLQGGLPFLNPLLPGAPSAQAATATSIQCNGQPYISRDAWRLSNADTASATFAEGSAVATATSPTRYNALGFNVLDGNIYGIYGGTVVNGTGNQLTRITPSGTIQNLGPVTGLPTGISYQGGDVDENGVMWVKPVNATAVMYKIDLKVTPYKATAVSLTSAVGIEDLAYNPVNGLLYGWTFSPVGRIAEINPTTGAVVLKNPAGLDAQANGEAIWFDGLGNMHVGFRDIGDVYQFSNLASATPTAVKISDRNAALAATDNSLDAAGCPYAPTIDKVFSPSNLSSAVGSTATLSFTLRNVLDGSLTVDLTDTLPTGLVYEAGTLVVSNATGTPNGYGGTASLAVTGITVPPNGTVTVTVTVRTSGNNIGGTLNNQARLTVPTTQTDPLVPTGVKGATIFSNNPAATLINEPTPINVYDSLECGARWFYWSGTGTANTGDLGWWNTAPTPWVGAGLQLSDLAGGPYEIMEYNVEDGFLYTLPATGNTLTSVDAGERRQTLGAVTGLPGTFAVAAAGFDETGNLYVKAGGATNVIYRIDVSTRVATAITLSASVNVQDLAVNPFNSTQAFAITTAGQLATINLTTGVVSLKTITGGAGVTDSEGLWFDSSGTLYALNQASNDVYAITNLTGATATATRVSGDRASVFGVDGTIDSTSCPYAPLARKSWSPASITPPATSQLTIDVINPLDVAVSVDVTDVLPSTLVQYVAGTLVVNNGSGTSNAYGGTQTLAVAGVTVPPNGTTVLTITVSNPLPLGGVVDNQASVTVPPGQPGVPAPLANTTTVSDNPTTTTVFQDKTRLVMSGPLPCDNRAYIMQQRATDTWGSMYGLDQTVADPTLELLYPQSPSTGANVNPASEFNGIGYNVVDGFIYGSVGTVQAGQPASIGAYDIVRIDGAGNAVYVNVNRSASVGSATTFSHVGDVTAGGLFYRPLDYPTGGDGIEIINLNNINYGTVPPSVSSTVVRLASAFPGGFADWAFNPTDGLLYASYTDATPNPNVERLIRINPVANGTATLVGTFSTPGAGAGAVWFDAFGSFYSYHNSNAADADFGSIVRWDNPHTAAPKAVLVDDDFPATAGNDGARCAYYPGFTKDVTPRIAPAGAVVTYTYTIRNGYPSGGQNLTADFVDSMDAGRTYVPGTVTITGQISAGTPATSAGDTQLDIPDIVVGPQQSATITVQVQTDPNTPDLETTVYNQATINGAVVQPVASDYPGTDDVLDDPTPLILVRPLECTDEAFLTHNVTAFPLTAFDRLTGEEASIADAGLLLNSLGYNPLDGLLYSLNSSGVAGTSNDLQAIDGDGNVFDLGDVANLPDTQSYNGATFDSQGRLWVKTSLASSTLLYAVNVATRTATAFTTSVALTNFGDFAYNPLDGKIYGFNWISDAQAQIIAIDISSAAAAKPTTVTTFNPPDDVDSLAQSQWIDGAGNLFIRANTDGDVWMLESPATTPAMLNIGNAATGSADGASCPRPELLKDVQPGQVAAGETVTYSFKITNPTPAPLSLGLLDNQDSGRLFAGGTLTVTNEAGATVPAADYIVNAYGGTGTLDIDSLDVPSGEVFTVTVQVQTDVSTPGGTLLNQAELTDLPARYGTVLSDFPDTIDAFDDPTPLVILGAEIDVEKSHTITTDNGQPGAADAGDVVTYSYLVTNTGEVPLTIAVADLLEVTTALTASCPATTLAPTASTTCTATYVVTVGDIDAQGGGDNDLDNVVTATGTTAPGGVVSDSDTDVVPLAQRSAALVVDKAYEITTDGGIAGLAEPGDVITYSYRITNTGTTTLTNVTAVDTHEGTGAPKPGTLVCSNTSLLPNQTGTCTAAYTVVQGDVDTITDGFLDDVVRVTATDPGGATLTGNDAESVPLPAQQPSITVDKTYVISADGGVAGTVDPGDVVTYSFRVINNGNATLEAVGVTDVREIAPQLTISCPLNILAPGEAMTCTALPVTITEADTVAEQDDLDTPRSINDVATAKGTETESTNVVSDTDEEAVPVTVLEPIYDATKSSSVDDGNGFVEPAELITYTITAINTGLVDAVDVPVTDPIPANTTFVSATGGGTLNATTVPPQVEWTIPFIAANGGSATVTFTVQADAVIPDEVTSIGNQATIDGSTPTCADPDEDGDPLTCDPTIDYIAKPSINIEKSHALTTDNGQAGVADVGDVIAYSYRVVNTGNVPLDPVSVTDLLEGVSVTVSCPQTTLALGATMTCTTTHTVTQVEFDARGGGDSDLDNVATAEGTFDVLDVEDSDDDVVQLAQPASGLTVDKSYVITGDVDGDGLADAGDEVAYTYVITNTGTVTLTNVGAVDDHEGVGAPVPGALTCAPTTLAPNRQAICTSTYTVVQADVDGQSDTSLDDTVTATGTPPTGPNATATDSESVPLPLAQPAITVDKTWVISPDLGTAGVVDPGDTVHYSYRVTNNGNVTLNVVGGDDTHELLGAVEIICPSVTLAPGESMTCISQWTATPPQVLAEQGDSDSPNAVTDAVDVSGTAPDGDIVRDTDDEAVPMLVLPPGIDVEKSHALSSDADSDGFADAGDQITYSYVVRNIGQVTLTNLVVGDALEGAPVPVSCSATGLALGASTTCTSTYTVDQADIDGAGGGDGDLDNTVTATADSVNGQVTDSDDDVVQLAQGAPGLSVDKTAVISTDANGNGIADAGDIVAYTYSITNTGAVDLTITSAVDDHESAGPQMLTCADTTLAPNDTTSCNPTLYTVTQPDIDGQTDGTLDDVVTVTGTDGSATLVGFDAESVPLPVNGPAIAVDKTYDIDPDGDTAGVIDAGDVVTYTYVVTNNGNVTLTNVGVADVHEIAGGVSASCVATTLAPGASTSCTSAYTATAADVLAEQTDLDTVNSITDVATGSGTAPDGNVVTDTDDEAVPVAALLPEIHVEKSHSLSTDVDGDGFADVGDQIAYGYLVRNTGGVELTGLAVSDVLEGAPVTVGCSTTTLAVDATTTCTSTYTITQADIDGAGGGDGDLDNTVTASATSINGDVTDTDTDVAPLAQAAPGLSVDKTATITTDGNGNGIADVGDIVTYGYTITNTGNVTLTGVGAVDDHESAGPTTLTCVDTTLAPNESTTCSVTTYAVTQPDVDSQTDPTLDDVVTATGTPPTGPDVSANDSESVPLPAQVPAITVDKTFIISSDGGTPGVVDAGDVVDYTYAVTNNGNTTLTDVGVVDTHEIAGAVTASCLASTLAPGASTTCTTTYTATVGGVYMEQTDPDTMRVITDVATASGTAPDGDVVTDSDDEGVPVVALPPEIDVEKSHMLSVDTDGDGFADVGDEITYSYAVTNIGGVDLTNVLVSDVLEGVVVTVNCPASALTVTESMECTSTHSVTQDEIDGVGGGDGDLDNTVTATGDSVNGSTEDTDVDVVQLAQAAPGLTVDKTAALTTDGNSNGIADAGDIVTYGYSITNSGNVTLTGVGAIDDHESAGSTTLVCTPGTLAPGESATCDPTTYMVTQPDIDNQTDPTLDDVVTATALTPSATTLTATDSESVPLPAQAPAITVDKTFAIAPDGGTAGVADAGDVVTYTYAVTNNGNTTLTGVGVVDTHEPAVQLTASCLVTTLLPGESTTCTAAYAVTAADVLAEQSDPDTERSITDVATASGAAPDGDVVSDTDDEAVPVVGLVPAVDVEKSHDISTDLDGDGFADAGDTVTYTYTVTNTGQLGLTNLVVDDVLEGAAVTVSCATDVIGIGGTITCTSAYVVMQTDVDGFGGGDGDLDNTVTATADSVNGPVSDSDVDVVPLGTGTTASDAGIGVQKSWELTVDANTIGLADAGDEVTYTYLVTNTGNEQLTNLAVDDTHEGVGPGAPSVIGCPDTTLDPGESVLCTATYVLVSGDFPGDDFTLDDTVVATAERPDSSTLHGVDSESVPLVVTTPNTPAIALDKEWALNPDADGDGIADAGEVVDYEFRVINNGTVSLTNVGVTDVHEGSPQLTIGCLDTTLDPGESTLCTASYTVTLPDVVGEQDDDDSPLLLADVATASGTAPNGNIVRDTDEEAVPVPYLAASIDVEKSHTLPPLTDAGLLGFADLGDVVAYSYVVENTGDVALTDVTVGDVLEGAAVTVICPSTTLAAGASMTCTSSYTVTPADINGSGGGDGDLDNTVTASGTSALGPVSDSDTDVVPLGPGLSISDAGIGVQKSWTFEDDDDANGNGLADAGDIVTYTYVVTNTGAEQLNNLVVDDNHEGAGAGAPDVISCPDTTLDPGESVTCAATYLVVPGDFPGDDFTLDDTVIATAQRPDSSTLHGVDSESVPLMVTTPNTPAIALDKEWTLSPDGDNDGIADADDVIEYEFRVINNGTVTLTGVGVTDVHEGDPQLAISCPDTTLDPGESTTCTASYQVMLTDIVNEQTDGDSPLLLADVATAAGTAPNGNVVRDTDEEAVPMQILLPSIDVEKSHTITDDVDDDGFADVDDEVTYTYAVENTGNVDLDPVSVDDLLEGQAVDVDCSGITTLAAGASMTCTSIHIVGQADVDGFGGGDGDLDNTVTATGTSPVGPVTDVDVDVVPLGTGTTASDAGIGVQKSWAFATDANSNGLADVGDIVTYTYVVTNTGVEQLTNLVVDDNHEGAGTPKPDVISCPDTTLDPGESVTCTANYTLAPGDLPGDDFTLDDTVVATAQRPDSSTLHGVDSESVPLVVTTPNTPAIALDKEWAFAQGGDVDGDGIADAGDEIAYSFKVVNNGTVTLTSVGVTDVHEDDPQLAIACLDSALDPGESTTCTATYTVTTQDTVDEQDAQEDSPLLLADVATASGTAPNGNIVRDTDEEAVPVPMLLPIIDSVKTVTENGGDGYADPGDVLTYQIAVTNSGLVSAANVAVSDPSLLANIAAGLVTYDTGSTTIDGSSAGDITGGITIPTVAPQSIVLVEFTVTVADPLPDGVVEIVNRATVGGEETCDDDTDADCDTEIPTPPNVTSVKTVADSGGDGFADPGDVLTYTITITNTGSAAPATPVEDALDPNTSFVAGSVTVGGGGVPAADVTTGFTVDVPAATSAAEPGVVVITFQVTVDDPMAPGVDAIVNLATIGDEPTCDDDPDPDCDTEIPTRPDVSSVKTVVDASGDGLASPGEMLTYTVVIANVGSANAPDEPFQDLLDPNTSFIVDTVQIDGVPQPGLEPHTGFLVSIPADDSVVVTFQVFVDNPLDPAAEEIANQSTIGGKPSCPDDQAAQPCDPTTIPVGRPGLTIDKSHVWLVDRGQVDAGDAGDLVRYEYLVTNTGDVALTSVSVDDLHEGTGTLSSIVCPATTLAAAEWMRCTAAYTVTQADVDDGGVIPNTATAQATTPIDEQITATDTDQIQVSTATPLLSVDKQYAITTDGGVQRQAEADDVVTYTYLVSNTGNVTLTDVGVVDDHEGSTSVVVPVCPGAPVTLAPGQQISCTATYTVTPPDQTLADGRIDDIATASGTAPSGAAVTSSDEESVPVVVAAPAITLDKTWELTVDNGTLGFADADDELTYTYVISNNGNVALDPVVLTDVHDGSGTFAQPVCLATTLAPGANTTCEATYIVTQDDVNAGGSITDVATATGTPPVGANVEDLDGEAVPLTPAMPAIDVQKEPAITADGGTPGEADAGDVITYTYTVTNTGNVTLTGVTVTDNHSGTGALSAVTCDVTELDPQGTATCTATYTVTAEDVAAGGYITNVATATGTPPTGGQVADDDSAQVKVIDVAALVVDKAGSFADTASNGTTGSLDVGEVITYTYTVRNAGNIPVDNIVVTDVHEGSDAVVVPSCPGSTLQAGQQMVCTASYTLTEADLVSRGGGDGALDNTATAAGTSEIGDVTSDPDDESLPLTAPNPAVTLDKRAVGSTITYTVGETVAYEIEAVNTGNITLTNVSIVDPRIPALDCGGFDGVLSPGEHVVCTGTLIVTQADADAGRVLNTATVTADQSIGGSISATDFTEVLAVPLQIPPTTVPPPPTTVPPTQPPPGDLPATGRNSTPIAQAAALLVAVGAIVLLSTRRRFRRRPISS